MLNSDYNVQCSQCEKALPSDLTTAVIFDEAPSAPESDEPHAEPVDLAWFHIEYKVGQGGMGTVYKAWDTDLERPVALKMIRPEYLSDHDTQVRQLLAEAKMASGLNHPNIVTIFGVFREPEGNFIAMEWVDGETLRNLIPHHGLAPELIMDYALGIAKGLARAHESKMIHRDIKPGNVMIDHDGMTSMIVGPSRKMPF